MAVLRNVPKTFSFEEQRIEINEIAQDLFDLSSANANLTVNQGNPGTASLSYDPSTGILTYIPPDFTGYLTTQTVYSVEALLSPGIQLLDDGNAQASNRVFFDGLDGVSISRKSGTTNTIEFSVSLDINDLGDVDTTGAAAPADGEALVWDQTAGKWKAEQLLMVNVNQFSVENTGTAGNGAGHLDYNQSTGLFTFSPATIPTVPTDVSAFNNDSGYLTTLPSHSINDHSDVDTTGVSQGKTLRYNGTNWVISQDVSYSQTILGGNTNAETSVQWDLTPTIDGGAGISDSITITGGNNVTFSSVSGSGFTIDAAGNTYGIEALISPGIQLLEGGNSPADKRIFFDAAGNGLNISRKTGTTDTIEFSVSLNINDLGDVDTTGITNGKILKSDSTGNWIIADAGTSINALNDIGDVNVGGTITDGHVLKWDNTNSEWVAGPDLTSSGGSGIALTDISVIKPNPAASGSGDLTYSSTSGAFTYTPPALFSGDYDDLTNKPTIPTVPTNVSSFTNDAGYLTSVGALGGLSDVDTTGAANNKILKHNGTSWVVADDEEGGGGILLSNISVVKPNPSASGSGDVTYDNTTGEFTYTPPSIPAAQVNSDWDATTGLAEILNKPTLFSGSYTDLTNKPTLFSGSYNDLTNKPTIPTTLDDLSDVTLGTASEGKILKYTSGSWSAEDAPGSGSTTLSGLTDTSIPGSITTGHVLKWDGSAWGPAPDLQGSGGSGIALSDLSVTKPNPSASGSGDVTYNSTSGAFTYTPPELFSGSYSDLTNKPSLFSGSYTDLTNKPTIPAAQIQADWDQTTTSALDYIKNKPSLFSGSYNDLTNKPTIPATLDNLTDVNLGTVSEGKILKYTSGSWSAEDGASGGETNVQSDWDETDSSHDAYINNKPTLFSGSYSDLTNKPTIPAAQIQSDWTQSNSTSLDFIKNKPTDVSAFNNDAGYLTSIGTITLDDLSGVSTSGVSNGQVLKYNGSSWAPAADTNYPTGGIGALTDVNWAGGGSPSANQVLQYDGSTWTNADAPSGVPSGTIVMYNSGSAPAGWAVCDGSNGTPDLTGKFIVGSGHNYTGGGYTDAIVVSHSHGSGNYYTSNTGGHSHGQGNYSTNNTGSHSHGDGNYSTSNTGSHSHSQSGSGSGSTGNQSHNHYHTTSENITIGGGSHTHTYSTYSETFTGDYHNEAALAMRAPTEQNTHSASHNHNFNFTVDTLGVSQNHTHDFNFNIGGNTGNSGSHSHNVSGTSDSGGSHSHNLSGSSGSAGDHSHNVSGTSDAAGSAGSMRNLPPYYTLTYIMKL